MISLVISIVTCAIGVAAFIIATRRQKKDDVEKAIGEAFGGFTSLSKANAAQLARYEIRMAAQDEKIATLTAQNITCEANLEQERRNSNDAFARIGALEAQLAAGGMT